jgi:hypothetical protein
VIQNAVMACGVSLEEKMLDKILYEVDSNDMPQ